MLKYKAVDELTETDEVYNWALTQEEMESVLLPTPEEYREELKNHVIDYIEKYKYKSVPRGIAGITINTKTGEIKCDY